MKRLRYYISGHGLGHASRSCQIIRTLHRHHGDITVDIVSGAPAWFFAAALGRPVQVRNALLDVGVIQEGSLILQESATLDACRQLLVRRAQIVDAEAELLRRDGVTLVAGDIPPLCFAAAGKARIPSVAIGNFSWDWIYEDFAGENPLWNEIIAAIRADYSCAEMLLRLPFHGNLAAFRRTVDLPMVARLGTMDPVHVRRLLGINEGKKVGLISFGGFGLKGYDFSALARLSDWVFISEGELGDAGPNLRTIPPHTLPYHELVRMADAVITKPGYGIVSEAIANDTAVLYASRGNFREQPYLVDGLKRFTRCLEIDSDSLLRGAWGSHLEQLVRLPSPGAPPPCNGDRVAGDAIADLMKQGAPCRTD